jgi:hypothetical protein
MFGKLMTWAMIVAGAYAANRLAGVEVAGGGIGTRALEAVTPVISTGTTSNWTQTPIASAGAPPVASAAAPISSLSSVKWPAASQFWIWMLTCLLAPLIALPAARKAFAEDSNGAILAVLLSLVAVSAGSAYALLIRFFDGWTSAVLMVAAIALAVVYNWHALLYIKKYC